MNEQVEKLVKEVLQLDEVERYILLAELKKHFCTTCGSNISGSTCWGCYDSPAENY